MQYTCEECIASSMKKGSDSFGDSHWARRLQQGDEKAFRQVYDTYHQRLYAFSLRFTRAPEDAKEVVQNTFLKLWQHRARLDAARPLEPYLYRIAKNENLKFLQKAAHHHVGQEAISPRNERTAASPEQEMIFAEYQAAAGRAIASLPPKRKLVYEMTHQQGKSVNEVAFAMGISAQTVRTQLAQALQSIRVYLKQHANITLLLAALLAKIL